MIIQKYLLPIIIFFFIPFFVHAEEFVSLQNYTTVQATQGGRFCQTFKAPTKNITSINVYGFEANQYHIEMILCKGNLNNVNDFRSIFTQRIQVPNYYDMTCATTTPSYEKARKILLNFQSMYNNGNLENKYTFSKPILTEEDASYYFCLSAIPGSDQTYMKIDNNHNYLDGAYVNDSGISSLIDLQFKIFSDIDVPDSWTDGLYDLKESEADFFTPYRDICFYGKDCNISIYYNYLAVGSKANFIWDNGQSIFPENASSTITLSPTIPYEDFFVIASTTAPTATNTLPYCVYLEDVTIKNPLTGVNMISDIQKCGMEIVWLDEESYDLGFFDEDPCATVASSTGLFDDFRYGVECGFRRLVFWAFKPDINAVNSLTSSRDKLSNNFPFSIYSDLQNVVTTTLDYDSATSTATLGAIFDNDDYKTEQFSLFSTDKITSSLGSAFTNYIYPFLKFLVWFACLVYIAYRLHHFTREEI